MSILGLVFKQKGVVIGRKDPGEGLLGEIGSKLVGGVGGIVVDATTNEEHTSTCDVTSNPVEEGAEITDHVQIKPVELKIDGTISDTPFGIPGLENFENAVASIGLIGGKIARSTDIYNQLVELQKTREPFTVVTSLRQYKNMIMTSLSVPRTPQTGKSVQFKAQMKEIRIVSSQTGIDNLKNTVKNLGSKTKNFGQKVTEPVPASSPIQSEAADSSGPTPSALSALTGLKN